MKNTCLYSQLVLYPIGQGRGFSGPSDCGFTHEFPVRGTFRGFTRDYITDLESPPPTNLSKSVDYIETVNS